MEAATQAGAESVHDRLMERLYPENEAVDESAAADESAEVEGAVEQEEVSDEIKAGAEEAEEVTEDAEDIESSKASSDDESESGEPLGVDVLADYLGIGADKLDVDDDGSLLVRAKVDGEEIQAKFSDLLKSYQLEGHLNKQNMEVVEQKKALQAKMSELDEQVQSKVKQLEDLSQIAYNELLSEYNSINWDELRQDDPAEYAAKFADYQARQSRIADMYQQAQAEKPSAEVPKERIQEEAHKLLSAVPEWKDPTVYQKDYTEIGQYAQSIGYTTDEFNSTIDHRLILLLNKARQFDALKENSPKVTKRVRKAPKLAKPGSTAKPKSTKDQKLAKMRNDIKKSGGKTSVRDYLLEKGVV